MKEYYKVMLVEPKRQMVHIYKNMIPWEEYGFEISMVADNENGALAYYGEYMHDLIITDVDLKAGNGISLIKKLKRVNPSCIVIVIAAHEDYDSVREAFLAGAYDYLLKSRIRYSSLAGVLDKVKDILENQSDKKEMDDWRMMLEKILGLIRDGQKVNYEVLSELLRREELDVLKNTYRLLYFRQDNIRNFNRSLKQYDKPNWMNTNEFVDMFRSKISLRDEIKIKLQDIIWEMIADIPGAQVQFTKKHSGIILLPDLPLSECIKLSENIIRTINARLAYECSITVSLQGKGIDSFVQVYQAAMEYHTHKFYVGDCCVMVMDEHKEYQNLSNHMASYGDAIVQGVCEQNFQKIEQGYTQMMEIMCADQIDPKQVKGYFVNVLEHTEQMMEKKGIEERYPFEVLKEGIMEAESSMYLKLELEKMFKTLIDWSRDHRISRYHQKVALMLEYIDMHIDKKVSLQQVADAADLSMTHASRMFKNDVGSSIIEYINQRKMEVAEAMMHEDTKKIKDIAWAVGIQDQLYFNKVFKKYYQISPREYRRKL